MGRNRGDRGKINSHYTHIHDIDSPGLVSSYNMEINAREYRRDNQKQTIQRNWQHMVHKTKKKQNKNTTQYALYTTIPKQDTNHLTNNRRQRQPNIASTWKQ